MSFPVFALFFCIVLWLVFGQPWLVNTLYEQKDKSPFRRTMYQLRYLAGIAISVLIELAAMGYERFF